MKCSNCSGSGEIERMDYNLTCPECRGKGTIPSALPLSWVIIAAVVLVGLFLASCETVEIEKLITDTVYIDRPVPGPTNTVTVTIRDTVETVIRDTVKVEVIVRDTIVNNVHTTDTVVQVVTKDSIVYKIVEKIVTIRDTVEIVVRDTVVNTVTIRDTVERVITVRDTVEVIRVEQRVMYRDTLYIPTVFKSTYSVPEELQPYVVEFYRLSNVYNRDTPGGPLIIQYGNPEDMPGDGWNSYSFWMGGQAVIGVNVNVPTAQLFTCILREMARLQINKKYTTGDKIMNTHFPPDKVLINSANRTPYLNELFK
jgi:hypothetical protein